MKKLFLLMVICALILGMIPVVSAAGNVGLKGPDAVRAGDTITVTFTAGGEDVYGGEATVSYDASQLTLNGYTTASLGGSWKVENTGDKFVFYDDAVSTPLGGTKTIFKASFTVKNLEPGTEISVSVNGVKLADRNFKDTNFGTKTYKTTILPPLSDNCALSSLVVSNASISPAFSPDVTGYSASVPFTTSKLELEAVAEHPGATVSVANTSLAAGETTTVKVTVKAENGKQKVYSIRVKRAQDPNYVPGSNAKLQELTLEGLPLSPAFSPDVTQYYVWMPYEWEMLTLQAEAEDQKATVSMGDTQAPLPGQRKNIAITVTAEDGSEQVYTVTAVRAPAHEDTEDYLAGRAPVQEEPEPSEPEPTVEETEPVEKTPVQIAQEASATTLPIVILAGACAACLVLGLLLGMLFFRKRETYDEPEEEEEEAL